ncbi:hypothetical protein LCGC14_1491840 [marine sediment metagenome]|uniref:Uncharacterized protein n=1 Tax=marine sediment metagenome TaxID=412755 RepID=A0A0F9J6I8_9ZZZZ
MSPQRTGCPHLLWQNNPPGFLYLKGFYDGDSNDACQRRDCRNVLCRCYDKGYDKPAELLGVFEETQ